MTVTWYRQFLHDLGPTQVNPQECNLPSRCLYLLESEGLATSVVTGKLKRRNEYYKRLHQHNTTQQQKCSTNNTLNRSTMAKTNHSSEIPRPCTCTRGMYATSHCTCKQHGSWGSACIQVAHYAEVTHHAGEHPTVRTILLSGYVLFEGTEKTDPLRLPVVSQNITDQ